MNLRTTLLILSIFFSSLAISQVQPREVEAESTTKKNNFDFRDNKSGTSMMPIMGDALPLIQYLEDTMQVEIVRIEYDLIFKETAKYTYRFLHKGWKYGIFAVGDYRVEQIKLSLFVKENNEWKFVTETTTSDYFARIDIEPEDTKEYAVEIKALKFKDGYKAGHYAILVYH